MQKYFFSLQKEAILKWLETIESLINQIDDTCIDRNLNVIEMEKDYCTFGYFCCVALDDLC